MPVLQRHVDREDRARGDRGAEHRAEREALVWAFDQYRFAIYGDTRRPLGYLFDGCQRRGPGRFACKIGIGYAYGEATSTHRVKVRVKVRDRHAALRRVRRTYTIAAGRNTDEFVPVRSSPSS